jgi:translation initiation factor eIF-2B subunit gamma
VPGSKSTKYKKERDLVGLASSQLCLFKAEADVEDEISIANRILRAVPRMTVHTNLQDAHLYILTKWVCDFLIKDK